MYVDRHGQKQPNNTKVMEKKTTEANSKTRETKKRKQRTNIEKQWVR